MKNTVLICLIVLVGKVYAQYDGASYSSERYADTLLGGWKIKVNTRLVQDHRLITTKAEWLLATELGSIEKILPSGSIPYLKEMPIWLEFTTPNGHPMQYHRAADWLKKNNYDPNKESALEITVIDYANMEHDSLPLLRLIAYAYMERVLGMKNQEIDEAYKHAKASDLYVTIAGRRKIFSFVSAGDYFASLSAAYFGQLSYEPYNRKKLKETDPRGYELVEKMWKVKG